MRPDFGLYDMLGNVGHWTSDCWHDSFNDARSDSSFVTLGDCGRRVERGGSWWNRPNIVRAGVRTSNNTSLRISTVGFRVARPL